MWWLLQGHPRNSQQQPRTHGTEVSTALRLQDPEHGLAPAAGNMTPGPLLGQARGFGSEAASPCLLSPSPAHGSPLSPAQHWQEVPKCFRDSFPQPCIIPVLQSSSPSAQSRLSSSWLPVLCSQYSLSPQSLGPASRRWGLKLSHGCHPSPRQNGWGLSICPWLTWPWEGQGVSHSKELAADLSTS